MKKVNQLCHFQIIKVKINYLNNLSNYNFFNTGKSSEKLIKMNTSEKIENNNNEDDNINNNIITNHINSKIMI